MADLITPTGSLAAGVQAVSFNAPKAQPVSDRPAQVDEPRPAQPETGNPGAPAMTLDRAVEALQAHVQQSSSELRFLVDKGTGKMYFKVVDHSTGEVILQIPSEEVLGAARKLREMADAKTAAGILVDQKG